MPWAGGGSDRTAVTAPRSQAAVEEADHVRYGVDSTNIAEDDD